MTFLQPAVLPEMLEISSHRAALGNLSMFQRVETSVGILVGEDPGCGYILPTGRYPYVLFFLLIGEFCPRRM
jgi:hypothetical protein